jgi:hypothetical protein
MDVAWHGTRVNTVKPQTWTELASVFKRNSDLPGENEANYQKALLSISSEPELLKQALARLSWIFWGFGLRPVRLSFWLLIVYLVFSFVYWTQTGPIAVNASLVERTRFACFLALGTP